MCEVIIFVGCEDDSYILYYSFSFLQNLFAQARLHFDSTLQIENGKYQYVEVIDQRNSSVIGTIKNSYIEAEGQFINDLEKHINTIMMKSDGRDTLLAVLYDCKVEDKPYYGDIVVYHFDATFYSGRGNQYQLVCAIDTFLEAHFVLKFFEKSLQNFNNLTVAIFQEAALEPLNISEKILTRDEASNHRQIEQSRFAVYKNQHVKNGLYYTMEDFINQTPTDTPVVKRINRSTG